LGIRAVVVDHCLLQELCGERDPAQLLHKGPARVGLVDVEVDVLAPDKRRKVVASERVTELIDFCLDVQGSDGAALAPKPRHGKAMPPAPQLVDESLLVVLRQNEVERPAKLLLESLANDRCGIKNTDAADKHGPLRVGKVQEA